MKPGVRAGCGLLFAASVWAMPALSSGAAAVDVAVLQGLDKITARVSEFEAPLGVPVRFGTFEITARACQKTPPEEPPESAAFLEIVDVKPDTPPIPLFNGWMFASSPALSAVEHPVYDVWVIDCRRIEADDSFGPGAEAPSLEQTPPEGQMLPEDLVPPEDLAPSEDRAAPEDQAPSAPAGQ